MTVISPRVRRPLAPERLPRLLAATASDLASHVECFGPAPDPNDLVGEVERSELRGRGGAGFPTARKMAAVASGRHSIVVANGTEGEPASAKDKTLLTLAPHLVIDGAVLAARAVGAYEVVICVERAATTVTAAVDHALAERRYARIDPVPIRLEATPSRYIAGEESALVHWLNGGEAKPTLTPPRPFQRGVAGRPTLVQNVETLGHVALIARYGAGWFRAMGGPGASGSTLVTVSGAVGRPGVYEVPLGARLSSVLDVAGRGAGPAGPVLVGGYFGTWIPSHLVGQIDLSAASLGPAGASLGCGVLAALPAGACGLAETARVTRWLADQSAGQCGPCLHGLDAIALAVEGLVRGDVDGQAERRLWRWLGMVKGRGACKHPDGAARFVESGLRVFAGEIELHRRRGPCWPAAPSVLPFPAPQGWR